MMLGSYARHSFTPKASTNIGRVEWTPDRSELQVTFKNGATHAFRDVPLGVFREMQKAKSAGSFFANHIKGRYVGRKLGSS